MRYNISQKLFESVVGYKVGDIKIFYEGEFDTIVDDVNTHLPLDTFFFMCKKWGYEKYGMIIDSRTTTAGSSFILSSPTQHEEEISKTFVDFNEQQAVFTACQWILDNIEKIGG
jgi:hypothetical protein